MITNQLVQNVLSLPEKFYSLSNVKSIYDLLKETGYFEVHETINKGIIEEELERSQKYIDDWLSWSENKRDGEGWYFIEKGSNDFVVGYIEDSMDAEKSTVYTNRISACSEFLMRELESIRKS